MWKGGGREIQQTQTVFLGTLQPQWGRYKIIQSKCSHYVHHKEAPQRDQNTMQLFQLLPQLKSSEHSSAKNYLSIYISHLPQSPDIGSRCMFCLFVWGFPSHSYGDVTITHEELHILTFARHSHLLWHGTSVYNGTIWGPETLTPIADRLECVQ